MLLDVSRSNAMRRGRSVSRPKKRITCGGHIENFEIGLIEIGDEIVMPVDNRDHEVDKAGRADDWWLLRRCPGLRSRRSWGLLREEAAGPTGLGEACCARAQIPETTNPMSSTNTTVQRRL